MEKKERERRKLDLVRASNPCRCLGRLNNYYVRTGPHLKIQPRDTRFHWSVHRPFQASTHYLGLAPPHIPKPHLSSNCHQFMA